VIEVEGRKYRVVEDKGLVGGQYVKVVLAGNGYRVIVKDENGQWKWHPKNYRTRGYIGM